MARDESKVHSSLLGGLSNLNPQSEVKSPTMPISDNSGGKDAPKETSAKEDSKANAEVVKSAALEDKREEPAFTRSAASMYSEVNTKDYRVTLTSREMNLRTQRIGVVITPILKRKLDVIQQAGKIKSVNDLINYLLEEYFKANEQYFM